MFVLLTMMTDWQDNDNNNNKEVNWQVNESRLIGRLFYSRNQ